MNYPTSTQHKSWIFTEEELEEKRKQNRQKSLDVIKKMRSESEANNGGEQPAEDEGAPPAGKQRKLKAISLEDEGKLKHYYATRVQMICASLKLPHKVQAAALQFLNRFYLSFSVLDHDPKDIFLTAIYLACKIEESYIGAEEFCRLAKQDEQTVLRNELTVLKGLNFDLITYAPYRSINGFLADLEDAAGQEGTLDAGLRSLVGPGLDRVRTAAKAAADALMLTDAPLLFPPGQLGLAALRSGVRKAGVSFSAYLKRVAERQAEAEGRAAADVEETLRSTLARIDEFGVRGMQAVNEAEVRKIDRRRMLYHNELLDPSSDAYRKAAEEKEKRVQQARLQKVAARHAERSAMEAILLGHGIGRQQQPVEGTPETFPASEEPSAKRQRTGDI